METFTALFASDIHMDNALPHSRPGADGVSDRLHDQIALLGQIADTCSERALEVVFIPGDLFNRRLVDGVTMRETCEALQAILDHARVTVVPGNHDAVGSAGSNFTVEHLRHLRGKHPLAIAGIEGGEPIKWNQGGRMMSYFTIFAKWLRFWPMAWRPDADARSCVEKMRRHPLMGRPGVNVLLMHQGVVGARHLGWECDRGVTADDIFSEGPESPAFDKAISGHFHTHQWFGPERRGAYLGAPMQHTYGDRDEVRGFHLVTFSEDDSWEWETIESGCPRFHETTMDDLAACMSMVRANDYVRIVAEYTHAEWAGLRATFEAVAEEMREASGAREVMVDHRPIYHHGVRDERVSEVAQAGSIRGMVEAYLRAPGVVSGELDRELLSKIADEALRACGVE